MSENLHIQIWRDKGWAVVTEQNPGRKEPERWTCEVYENVGKPPLPRALGYICGYGPDEDAAVNDAAFKLKHEMPEAETKPD